jgi:hypothetical protein
MIEFDTAVLQTGTHDRQSFAKQGVGELAVGIAYRQLPKSSFLPSKGREARVGMPRLSDYVKVVGRDHTCLDSQKFI